MIYDTGKYIDILVRLDITPNQFMIAWLIYNKQWDETKKYMKKFGNFSAADIRDLMNKDIIISLNPSDKAMKASDLHVTELFADEMIISGEDAWDELMEKYPGKLKINDIQFASKGLTISDERACREKYQKVLKGNKYLHHNILALVEKWKNDNGGFATMKIDKFIISEYWKEIETERSNHVGPALF